MKTLKKIMSLVMVFAMVLTFAPFNLFVFADEEQGNPLEWSIIENNNERIAQRLNQAGDFDQEEEPLTGVVRVSIVLDAPSTLAAGYSTERISANPEAQAYRESLKDAQSDMAAVISKEVLDGEKLDVVWNLTLAANIISANVDAEKISQIKALPGVKDVVVEKQYQPETAEVNADDPNMSVATEMTNTNFAWQSGYTGAGSLIAIVDTGLDYKHQSFDPECFDFAISRLEKEEGKEVDLLTASDVQKLWLMGGLNAAERAANASPQQAYVNSKVPFGFNYVDSDFDIEHVNDTQGEHGSHVAGIAAANRFVLQIEEDGSYVYKNAITGVRTQGNAPDAQLLVMKVFGKGGGAYDSDYFAAIEDAIFIGADSVNLSLGSGAKGFGFDTAYADIINSLMDSNIIWANSAGNNGSWADQTTIGYLYSDYANLGTGGSPATFPTSMSVASVDNDGASGAYIVLGDDLIFYTETSYGQAYLNTIAGDYEYVYIDGPGVDDNTHVGLEGDNFLALGREVVEGKIAVCNRGGSSFYAKANAAMAQGAVAVIIVNNTAGTISMNLTGYTGRIPVVSITQEDGGKLMEAGEQKEANGVSYFSGSFTVSQIADTTKYNSDYYTMSNFSSWGIPENLTLKPEITAPGGNIYAPNGAAVANIQGVGNVPTGGHDQYENMSGTSMASPQLAGMVGVFSQFYRESGLAQQAEKFGLTKRQVLQSLLMSTATPLIEEESGNYYSVMRQGAGLANLEAAMNSNVVVMMKSTAVDGQARKDITEYAADGKVKAELGDDPERTGNYTVEFTLSNLSDEDRYYDLSADFFTQDMFEELTFDSNFNPITDEEGNPIYSQYLDTWTVPLTANLTWYLNGEEYIQDVTVDVNGDQKFNADDVQAILNFITGVEDENTVVNEDDADFDEDGEITSYDAYLALKLVNQSTTVIPAGETVTVTLNAQLADIADFDEMSGNNGAYVEGYIFATEKESEDGAFGVEHSIPVLGYYGGWDEPAMVDVGSNTEDQYGLEPRPAYLGSVSQAFIGKHATLGVNYALGGNPLGTDTEYKPERNAINAGTALTGTSYTLVRNSSGYRYQLTAEDGTVVDDTKRATNAYAAYYYPAGGEWRSASTSTTYGYKLTDYADGTRFTLSYSLAPEYYLDYATGQINWDEINPTWELPFVIDSEAPQFRSVFGQRRTSETEEGETSTVLITVSARDNEYLAGCFVYAEDGTELYAINAREDDKASADQLDRQNYVIELPGDDVPDHIEVEIWDYAANVTTAQINLNEDELDGPVSISLDATEVNAVVGNAVRLVATVSPWGLEDQSVTWTSSDETIATVNEGLVTGLEEGQVVITATANADPTQSASCIFTFMRIDRDLKGIVWDEKGEVWFSEFNLKDLPEYTKLNASSARLPLASTAYGKDGTLYVASFDSEEILSDLYVVNEETFEATLIGSSDIGYMDIAPAPSLGDNILVGVYGPYLLIIDATTGAYTGAFNLGSYTGNNALVGIAYEEQYNHSMYGNTDWYFLVDQAGNLYNTGLVPVDGSISRFGVTAIGNLGFSADVPYFQSLYYDGTDLYWSNYNEAADKVDVIFVNDLYNEGSIFNAGSFAPQVWPVGGLYTDAEKELIGLTAPEDPTKAEAVLDESAEFVTEIAPIYGNKSEADGSLNSVNAASNAGRRADLNAMSQGTTEDGRETVTITIDAAGDVEGEEGNVTHNGLYTVTYDPEALLLRDVKSDADYYSFLNNYEDGVITFAFADTTGFAEGAAVAEVEFILNTEDETTVVVATDESENNFESEDEVEYVINEKATVNVSAALALGESIDIRLYVTDLSKPENPENYTVEYSFAGGETTVATLGKDIQADSRGRYRIEIKTTARQMTDTVKLVVKYKGRVIHTLNDYSVQKYCHTALGRDGGEKIKALCRALLEYGTAAQKYFSNYNADKPANEQYNDTEFVTELSVPNEWASKSTGTALDAGLASVSTALRLESQTELVFYLKPSANQSLDEYDISVVDSVTGVEREITTELQPSGSIKVVVKGIIAKDLGNMLELRVTCGGTYKMTYSPMTYVYAVQSRSNNNDLKYLTKALYNYYLKAVNYFSE